MNGPSGPPRRLAVVALGANLPTDAGGPLGTLLSAVDEIKALPGVSKPALSRWYRSAAVPAGSGPDFVNAAMRLATGVGPEALLSQLHAIEDRLGRARPARWAPRVCDLDLVAMDALVRPDAETEAHWRGLSAEEAARRVPDRLILPHPRLAERAFVLLPMLDVAPDWRHPVTGLGVREMADALDPADRAATVPL